MSKNKTLLTPVSAFHDSEEFPTRACPNEASANGAGLEDFPGSDSTLASAEQHGFS